MAHKYLFLKNASRNTAKISKILAEWWLTAKRCCFVSGQLHFLSFVCDGYDCVLLRLTFCTYHVEKRWNNHCLKHWNGAKGDNVEH